MIVRVLQFGDAGLLSSRFDLNGGASFRVRSSVPYRLSNSDPVFTLQLYERGTALSGVLYSVLQALAVRSGMATD
jgi:hypothetical protein